MRTTPIWWPVTEMRDVGSGWYFRADEELAGLPSVRINPLTHMGESWTGFTLEGALANRLGPVVGHELDPELIRFGSVDGVRVEILVRATGTDLWHAGWGAWVVESEQLRDPVLVVHTRCGLWLDAITGFDQATHGEHCARCLPIVPIPNSMTRELGHIGDWSALEVIDDEVVRSEFRISNITTGTRTVYTFETSGRQMGIGVGYTDDPALVGVHVDALPGVDVDVLQEAVVTASLTNTVTLATRYYRQGKDLRRGMVREVLGIDEGPPKREAAADRYRRILEVHRSAPHGEKARSVMEMEPGINTLQSARDLIKRALRWAETDG